MTTIRFIAIDLDGTLLDKHSRISEANAVALQNALQKGMIITFASGKPYAAIAPLLQRFAITAPQIALNGGLVIDPERDETWLQQSFAAEESDWLIAELRLAEIPFVVYTQRQSYSAEEYPQLRHLEEIGEPRPLLQTELAGSEPVLKILTFTDASQEEREAWLQSLSNDSRGRIIAVRTSPVLFEFIPAGGGKGSALQLIAERLNLRRDEMVAIGDSENDRSMLLSVGMPIAMGNAAPALQQLARLVVADNNHSGVAEALDLVINAEGRIKTDMEGSC